MPRTPITRVTTIGISNAFEAIKASNDRKSNKDNEKMSHERENPTNPLICALKHMFISMTILGICDYWKLLQNGRRRSFRENIRRAYRLTLVSVLVCNVIRYCPAYASSSDFGAELLTTVLLHGWYIQCAANCVVCYSIVQNPQKLGHFFTLWEKYWRRANDVWGNDTGEVENALICKKIRKISMVCTLLSWMFIVGNFTFIYYTVFYTNTFPGSIAPYTFQHRHVNIIKGVYLVVVFYLSGVWVYTGITMFVIHLSLYFAVKQFTQKFDEIISKTTKEVQEGMEAVRSLYNDLCQLIEVVDNIFQFCVGVGLFTYIFLTLILVYNICWYETVRNSPAQLVSHIFWLSGMATMLCTLMAACCVVNNWVHAPVNTLYNLTLIGFTGDFAFQVNMFLHRLNGSPIGLSALSLFVIDKTVVVSVGGMLATYFVVLLQFQQSTTDIAEGLNATSNTL